MDKIDRIMESTNRYLERFGKALIGIYYLPPLAENWKFTVFINSLLVTLRFPTDPTTPQRFNIYCCRTAMGTLVFGSFQTDFNTF